jgi:hypothetical protein
LLVLGFELRALWFLGWGSTAWSRNLALFALVVFQTVFHISALASADLDSTMYISQVPGITVVCYLFVGWDEVSWTFCPSWHKTVIFLPQAWATGSGYLIDWLSVWLAVLGIKSRASHMLGKPFSLYLFLKQGLVVFAQAGLKLITLLFLPPK